jgi:fatty-acyl-CoA synthase
VVAVLMKNSTAFLELVFATSHIGAVFLPINYRLSADEIGYIVSNSGARLLIADEELAAIAAGNAPIVLLDEAAQASATKLAPEAEPAPMHPRRPDDLMRLMYTSGTTDRPKGVILPKTPTAKVEKHVLRAEGVTGDTWDRERAGILIRREKL